MNKKKINLKKINNNFKWLFCFENFNMISKQNTFFLLDYMKYKKNYVTKNFYLKNLIFLYKNLDYNEAEKNSILVLLNNFFDNQNFSGLTLFDERQKLWFNLLKYSNFAGLSFLLDKYSSYHEKNGEYHSLLDFCFKIINKKKLNFNLFFLNFFSKNIFYSNNDEIFKNVFFDFEYLLQINNANYFDNYSIQLLNFFWKNKNYFDSLYLDLKLKGFFFDIKSLSNKKFNFDFFYYTEFNFLKLNNLNFIYNYLYFLLILFFKNIIKYHNSFYFLKIKIEFKRWFQKKIKQLVSLDFLELLNLLVFNFFLVQKSINKIFFIYIYRFFNQIKKNIHIFDIIGFSNQFDLLIYKNNLSFLDMIKKKTNLLINNDPFFLLNSFFQYENLTNFFLKKNCLINLNFLKNFFLNNIFWVFKEKKSFCFEKPFDFYIILYYLFLLKLLNFFKVIEKQNKFILKKYSWFILDNSLIKAYRTYNLFNSQIFNSEKIIYERPFFWLKNKNFNNIFFFLLTRPNFLLKFLFFTISFTQISFNLKEILKKNNYNFSHFDLNLVNFFFNLKKNSLNLNQNDWNYNYFIFSFIEKEKLSLNEFYFNFFLKRRFFFFVQKILNKNVNLIFNNELNENFSYNYLYTFLKNYPIKNFLNNNLNYYLKNFLFIDSVYKKYFELNNSMSNFISHSKKIGLDHVHFNFFSFFHYHNYKILTKILKKEIYCGSNNKLFGSFFLNLNYSILSQDNIDLTPNFHKNYFNDNLDDNYFNKEILNNFQLFLNKVSKNNNFTTFFLNGTIFLNPAFLNVEMVFENKNQFFFFNYFESFNFINKIYEIKKNNFYLLKNNNFLKTQNLFINFEFLKNYKNFYLLKNNEFFSVLFYKFFIFLYVINEIKKFNLEKNKKENFSFYTNRYIKTSFFKDCYVFLIKLNKYKKINNKILLIFYQYYYFYNLKNKITKDYLFLSKKLIFFLIQERFFL